MTKGEAWKNCSRRGRSPQASSGNKKYPPLQGDIAENQESAKEARKTEKQVEISHTSFCCKNRSRFMLKPLDRKTMTMCKVSNNKNCLSNQYDKKKSKFTRRKRSRMNTPLGNNAIMLSKDEDEEEDGQKKLNQNDKRGERIQS